MISKHRKLQILPTGCYHLPPNHWLTRLAEHSHPAFLKGMLWVKHTIQWEMSQCSITATSIKYHCNMLLTQQNSHSSMKDFTFSSSTTAALPRYHSSYIVFSSCSTWTYFLSVSRKLFFITFITYVYIFTGFMSDKASLVSHSTFNGWTHVLEA